MSYFAWFFGVAFIVSMSFHMNNLVSGDYRDFLIVLTIALIIFFTIGMGILNSEVK